MTTLAIALLTGLWLRWRVGRGVDEQNDVATGSGRPEQALRKAPLASLLTILLLLVAVDISTGSVSVFFIVLVVAALISLIVGVGR